MWFVRSKLIIFVLIASLALSFVLGCAVGNRLSPGPAHGLEVIREAWGIIFHDYVDRDSLDANELSRAAIEGMIEVIDDPYTSYLDAETYKLRLEHLRGEFSGIGARVSMQEGKLTIIAAIPGSPAAVAGIRAGDIILAIDGEPTGTMSLAEAVLEVRGKEGMPVTLLIQRHDAIEPEEIVIIRAEIKLPSIFFEMRNGMAIINITHFSERTDEELLSVVEQLLQEKAEGIVVDLRTNPGGLLDAVVAVASRFLSAGRLIVTVVDNAGRSSVHEAREGAVAIDLPLVVLTDKYSASGSEVLAGALQDHGRAIIAGSKTLGKGSVNILRQLKDGSGIYITTARWLTPNGRLIEGNGIHPDYELELEGEDAVQWAIDYLEGETGGNAPHTTTDWKPQIEDKQ